MDNSWQLAFFFFIGLRFASCGQAVERKVEKVSKVDFLGYDYSFDDYSEEEIEDEFEYFYKLQMLEALDRHASKTEADEKALSFDEYDGETSYYEDSTELDLIVDDLLNEEDLIEVALDDFDENMPMPNSKSHVTRADIRESPSLLNPILLICFLVVPICILLINLAWTACHCYKKVNTAEENVAETDEPNSTILLRAGRKILWKWASKRHMLRPEQWI
eukprot:GFUD01008837.1.p1 GENE.GFUD01008837.1~~GFUD01008837.1.p1  ORF type:complete len:232 (+),score=67.87 GFUD01008837.1:41-697(+)